MQRALTLLGVALLLLGSLIVGNNLPRAQVIPPPGQVAIACANNAAPPTPTIGQFYLIQCDSTGALLISGAGSQATIINLLQQLVNQAIPACANTPVVSASAEGAHVFKVSQGTLCGAYAINLTNTPGYLVELNSATAPADGAITPLDCTILPAFGVASIAYGLGNGSFYSTGITAVLTSASTCFTKTTGVITGLIHGQVL